MINNIRNIIFDLGGVLIDWQPSAVYKTIFDTSEEVDWFLDNICTMEWNVIQDAGRSLKEATEVLQKQHPDWHDEIAAFYGRWTEMLV
ncbi:MAG: HAD family phosphatase, partial [Saprospiraceae bacterium]|nr:HAD family phosphatase [Saprospiraceae bacterium]